jgi:hypothetical protein
MNKKKELTVRRFWSYGTIDVEEHYYAPRKELIERAYNQLMGENLRKGGHYITVWAPRQTGKSWVMQEVLLRLKNNPQFDTIKISLESLKNIEDLGLIIITIAQRIGKRLGKDFGRIDNLLDFQEIFSKDKLARPLILMLDEFDALPKDAISSIVSVFREIYNERRDEVDQSTEKKGYLLHAVALIGVRSVVGIESKRGSPFNVQRSLHIPNLTYEEVEGMFKWYEKESEQKVEKEVIERIFYETRGQPGLTCWLGELMTEGFEDYTNDTSRSIGITEFEAVYAAAASTLPNNNILNIISKAREESNKTLIFEMFQTDEKLRFRFDDPTINKLYMNGIVEKEKSDNNRYYVRFSCPFVQKRLFNYFSNELFRKMGQLVEPFCNLDHVITPTHLDIRELMKLYQTYLEKNKSWLFKNAPRRRDLRLYEAVFHFNLYAYIDKFLQNRNGLVFPEFPTGNGKIDLLIQYNQTTYGIEIKSFTDQAGYHQACEKAAQYGKQLKLTEIYLVTFVESIDEKTREAYENDYLDPSTNVTVKPIFLQTGGF